ncbi:MAG TPA: YciI family protein [Candidatus Kapabacteria bacterium]|nr:YciI family protein [Candidatus Kapabacteria bacterium]
MEKKYFFLKLLPPRESFVLDMTPEERNIMLEHISYWAPYVEKGIMVAMGPVMAPDGGYGIGIIEVDTREELDTLLANDPATKLHHYEVYSMPALSRYR